MARITVEDCLKFVDNHFELVILASKRARQLTTTATEPKIVSGNDRPTVVALREIAAGYVNFTEVEADELGEQGDISAA